ncbi:MAG: hypothetical protein ABFD44_09245 [Anaerolineaceae bacterium]
MILDDPKTFFIGLCLIVGVVILVNLSLVAAIRGKNPHANTMRHAEILHKAGTSIKDPWKEEDQNLAELSRRVASLRDQMPSEENDHEDSK